MPDVIIGLSLLLMLVSVQRALGWPERGLVTILLGHLLLGMAYATVVVQSRLRELEPAARGGGDGPRRAPVPGLHAGDAADDRAGPSCRPGC